VDIKELDVVTLTTALPDQSLEAGAIGTVVHVFQTPNTAFEVEFVDDDGMTTAMATLTRDQFRRWNSDAPA
jgi:uncharacterized protein DUF4926